MFLVSLLSLYFLGKLSSYLAMTIWSDLPRDLLQEIAECLENHFDLLHFRAVCPSWRASAPSNLVPPPSYSPVKRLDKNGGKMVLLKRTISLFKFPQLHNQTIIPHFWLVKLEQDDESGKTRILHPLSSVNDLKQVKKCPIVLNSCRFHSHDLAHEYVLQATTDEDGTMAVKTSYMNTNGGTFLVFGDDDEDLGLFKLGDEEPTWMEVEGWSSAYADSILFNGKFYAVDTLGRAVAIEHHSGTMTPVSDKLMASGEKNFLVEFGRNLLLVTMFCGITNPTKTCWFQVYQLDEERKKWDRVNNLGDGILFLGEYCNFSVPGIPGVRGNCIVYSYEILNADGSNRRLKREDDAYVFHMGNQSVVPLTHSDGYLMLFRPPLLS